MVQYEAYKHINGETMLQNSLAYQVLFPLHLYVWILFKELYFFFRSDTADLKRYIQEVKISGGED